MTTVLMSLKKIKLKDAILIREYRKKNAPDYLTFGWLGRHIVRKGVVVSKLNVRTVTFSFMFFGREEYYLIRN